MELLVVTAIFSIATIVLLVVFDGQDSFTNRSVLENLKNGIRDALVREMTERGGNGYVRIENEKQGFTYVQGGKHPYRLTGVPHAMGIDGATTQTTFSLQVEKLSGTAYVPLSSALAGESLSLVYYPENKAESVADTSAAPTPTPPAYSTTLDRSSLGNRTIFYLQKNGKPVSNRVEFVFYSGRNVNANASDDTLSALSSTTTVSHVQITVNALGNMTAVNDLNTNATMLQLRKDGSDLGAPLAIPLDLQ